MLWSTLLANVTDPVGQINVVKLKFLVLQILPIG